MIKPNFSTTDKNTFHIKDESLSLERKLINQTYEMVSAHRRKHQF